MIVIYQPKDRFMTHRIKTATARGACIALLLAMAAPVAGQRLRPADVDTLPASAPVVTEAYGVDANQTGDLRLPDGKGPFPVVIVIHGGCWTKGFATRRNTAALATALTARGFATWNIDYRQIGDAGGGWPGSFQDWGAGTDHLRELAKRYPLDLDRVAVTGHSAGAHAALWVAARPKLSNPGEIASRNPLRIGAVVAIDGPPDPESEREAFEKGCGVPAVTGLFGGSAKDHPARYAAGTPQKMAPLGIKSGVISASLFLSPAAAVRWVNAARVGGDQASALILGGTGHFEVIAPGSPVWPQVEPFLVANLTVRP